MRMKNAQLVFCISKRLKNGIDVLTRLIFSTVRIRKTCIFASLVLRAFINILIQVILPNVIIYLERTFKEEQNDNHFVIISLYHYDIIISL